MDNNKQMRFSKEELDWIKAIFGGEKGEGNLKILRKVFLPEFRYDAPIGQNIDLWMTVNLANMSQMDKEVRLQARNEVIPHLETQLVQLHVLANVKEETPEARKERILKDSTK